jgi:AcrR family transcriptional regulator
VAAGALANIRIEKIAAKSAAGIGEILLSLAAPGSWVDIVNLTAVVDLVNLSGFSLSMTKDTRSKLVAAAAELLDTGGPASVTLREVGKRAGVSHNAPYKHFASKEDLLAAIATRELSQQSDQMNEIDPRKKPLDTLRRLMHAYIAWARTYPERFRLTFGAWSGKSQELDEAAKRTRALFVSIAKSAQAANELPPGNPERTAYLMLALAHGAVDLALAGHLSAKGKGAADPEMLVDDLVALIKAQVKRHRRDGGATG